MAAMGWSRYYVNKATSIVCRAYKWAVSEELVEANIETALRSVPGLQYGRTDARKRSRSGRSTTK